MPTSNKSWLTVLCEEKRPRYIDGRQIPNWQQGPTVSETVTYLGAQGWMLLKGSALWAGHGDLTFIRPQRLVIECEEKRPRYVNGKEIPDWRQGPTISEAVNYLNAKGWMLHADPSVLQRGHGKLTFIRPRQ